MAVSFGVEGGGGAWPLGAGVGALVVVVVVADFWAVALALGAVRLCGRMNMVPATTAGALGQGPTGVATAAGAMDFGLATTALAVASGCWVDLAATRAGA